MKDKTLEGISSQYISPVIVEEHPLNVSQMDVYSRLLMDRILFLSGTICSDNIDILVAQLLFLDSQNNKPIHLYVNSGGGDCYSGLELISVMNYIKSPVYTTVLGLAASMGAVIASSGEKGFRKALPYSRFMIHQPLSGIPPMTQYSDQMIHLEEMKSVRDDLYELLAKNSGHSIDEIEKLCDRDNWMKPEEAIREGFLDAVVTN